MGTEEYSQQNNQSSGQAPTDPDESGDNETAAERVVGVAKEQATEAADALRRGQFISDPVIDEQASPDDRLIAMLSYASQIVLPVVMPVIVLISESSKRHPFQRYHAVQSLALMILLLGTGAVALTGTAILSALPIIGALFGMMGGLLCCLTPLALVMVVMALAFYGYQAYQGKRFAIPGLTSFLSDQGWLN